MLFWTLVVLALVHAARGDLPPPVPARRHAGAHAAAQLAARSRPPIRKHPMSSARVVPAVALFACSRPAAAPCMRGRLRAGGRFVAGVRRHLPGRSVHRSLPRIRHAAVASIRQQLAGSKLDVDIPLADRDHRQQRLRRRDARRCILRCGPVSAGALQRDEVPQSRRQPLCRRRHARPARRQQTGDVHVHLDARARNRC